MKKHLKLIVFIITVFSIYLIFIFNNKNNKIYLSVGDSLSLGENSYGATNYGYSDYFADYLIEKKLLSNYNKSYTSKDKTILNLYNDILVDDTIIVDNYSYNLKRLLRETSILTLSIGINDIILESNLKNNKLTEYEENRIINVVFENYKKLIKEIKKYYHYKIYIIGYYENNTEYDKLLLKLNKKYKKYCKEKNDIYIDTTFLSNNYKYFDNYNSYYPNELAYKKIASKVINAYKNR